MSSARGTLSRSRLRPLPRWLWLMVLVVIPAVLVLHVWRTLEMLETQQDLYLRNRVALLASRLEALPETGDGAEADDWVAALYEEDSALDDVKVFAAPGEDAVATAILAGRELFRTERVTQNGVAMLRAWVPFHRAGQLRVARLDFDTVAADFLSVYAWQSIGLVTVIAAALIGLAVYAFRMAARTALLQERQAEMAHLAKLGEMAAVLAHEIRNPLGSIKGFAQLIQEEASGTEGGFAGEIVEQSTRLERLVDDLLQYGRVPAPDFGRVGWQQVVEGIRLRGRFWEGGGPRVVLGEADVTLDTDAALLEQALMNLLRNSREALAGNAAGEVSLQAWAEGELAVIEVLDNGPGLSAEAQARLYEPFFTTKAFGTGLGLATTRKLIAALGGELELRNREEGGLRATIRLPLVSQE